MPERLLGANQGNPKGHWEPLDALELNERILTEHDASWYDPTLRIQREITFSQKERERYLEMIREFLLGFSSQRLVIVKEPRIAALSDLWFEAVRRSGFDLKIIIPLRHPDEVAASLAKRDGLAFELSSVLWLKYNLLAERCSRLLPRVFVEYTNLLSNWRAEIGRISESLSIDLRAPDAAVIEEFLARDLYRERHSGIPTDVFGLPWISSAYANLSGAARGEALDTRLMDEIFAAFSSCEKTFRTAIHQFRAMSRPIYENKLDRLTDFFSRSGARGRDARDLESRIAWLLWILGFSVGHFGGTDPNQETADLIAVTPKGHFAVIECTTGSLREGNKISLVIDRAARVRQSVAASNNKEVRVLPVIVGSRARAEIGADIEQAEKQGVLVISRENLEQAVAGNLVFVNAEQLYEAAIKRVDSAKAKHEAQLLL